MRIYKAGAIAAALPFDQLIGALRAQVCTVFKSVGTALEDRTAEMLVHRPKD